MTVWTYAELRVQYAVVEDEQLKGLETPYVIATNGEALQEPLPLKAALDTLGAEGWELVSVLPERQHDGMLIHARFMLKAPEGAVRSGPVGEVVSYDADSGAAEVRLNRALRVGDVVTFSGSETDFNQRIAALQLEAAPADSARAGQVVWVEVNQPVSAGDRLVAVAEE